MKKCKCFRNRRCKEFTYLLFLKLPNTTKTMFKLVGTIKELNSKDGYCVQVRIEFPLLFLRRCVDLCTVVSFWIAAA